MNYKVKKGDRVRCINNRGMEDYLKVGRIYIVGSYITNEKFINLDIIYLCGWLMPWYRVCFIPVQISLPGIY